MMVGARAGRCVLVSLLALGCGARTGLDSDEPSSIAAGAGRAGDDGRAGGGRAGIDGRAGAGGATVPPVSTNCQLTGDDPRVAGIKPDQVATLDGANFVRGDVKSYHWTLQPEDCDAVVQNAQFTLQGTDSQIVKFQPSRPAFYHFTLEVTGVAGDHSSCKLEVPVEGVGMRVELCWDTSTSTDLDLYLHTPFDQEPWFARESTSILDRGLNNTTCNTSNAAATLRGLQRVNWGYADSALSACNTPSFESFLGIGSCPNPRAADDNNQFIATGTTERMQLDDPHDGQRFRVMVQNYNNQPARPHVFVYCGGQRAGAFDAPSSPPNFVGNDLGGYGLMWRAADITTRLSASGKVSCSTTEVAGAALTVNNPMF